MASSAHVPAASGFVLVDLLVATVVLGALAFGLVAIVQAAAAEIRLQPAAGDTQQRLRSAVHTVSDRLALAGLGATVGVAAGPLSRRVPVVFPHRRFPAGSDAELSAYSDRFTVFAVAPDGVLAPLAVPMASTSAPLRLAAVAGCAPANPSCRFPPGTRVLIFDATGAFDVFVVTATDADTVSHAGALSRAYDPVNGAGVVPLDARSIFHDAPGAQLRATSGGSTSFPLLDGIAGLRVRYFGAAEPPRSPRPPPGAAGCLYDAGGGFTLPALEPDWGALTELPLTRLRDGPVCGSPPNRFDGDLFRVRQLRVTLRVESTDPATRGSNPLDFANPGSATRRSRMFPDMEVTFDVAPPNLRDGR